MAAVDSRTSLEELRKVIREVPVIDNHAHNLLRPHGLRTGELLTLTTEASGDALEDAPTSLAHIRAARQLCKLYDLPADASWELIKKRRLDLLETDADALTKKCLEGTETILVDDGLAKPDDIEPYAWHNSFTTSPCKRIVRIETVASDILSALHQQGKLPVGLAISDEEACSLGWVSFITGFEQAIAASVEDPEVVGFKSVVCYRTGLDVKLGRDLDVTEDGLRSFRRHFLVDCVARNFRVETKGMNDALVISTCKLIAAGYRQRDVAKPLQFHTGLGDNDISLLDSNPGCLQPLIAEYPTVPIVLLHSSYPYTREAGYLATVYKNCYLDVGEVFPMVSRDGQENILRQSLELTPWSKLLWSTDGHFFPETFWLANVQGREVVEKVLCEYVEQKDLTVAQAVRAVKDLFFENSNRLYRLRLKLDTETKSVPERPEEDMQPKVEEIALTNLIGHPATMAESLQKVHSIPLNVNSRYSFRQAYVPFIEAYPETKFIFVQWIDFLGLMRTRCLPIKEFRKLLFVEDGSIKISNGNLGTLQNDSMSPVCEPVGAICVEPDLTLASLRPMQSLGPLKNTATVMARFTNEEGRPLHLCPRSALQRLLGIFEAEFKVDFLVGFEIEVTFCRRMGTKADDDFEPLDSNHAWGTFTDEQYMKSFNLMLSITTALQDIGIDVSTMHSEAGAGQYEFVLPPLPPVAAIDTLIQARQCIMQIATTHGLRATCHPQPFPGIGTAAHAHISFNRGGAPNPDLEDLEMPFMASVLEHMPSLCAFTMPQPTSYGRVLDNGWTGGTWIAWGTQNREVPLRKSAYLRWEIKFLDGLANTYLAIAAIMAAGLVGLRNKTEMQMQDCLRNPAKLSSEQLKELGITKKLPTSLEQSIEAAEQDAELDKTMSPGILKHYISMKKAEQEMLSEKNEQELRIWLMERY